jgi:hypothetical protein
VLTIRTKCTTQVFINWLVDLENICANKGWKRDSLEMMIFVNGSSSWSVVELRRRSETWRTEKDVNVVIMFHLPYLMTLMAYLFSQLAPNVQIKFLLLDWSIYRLFVLNRGWKGVSFQMMIFVYVCSTCSVVEIKTRVENWIARNCVNYLYWFLFSYLITVLAYLCSQCAPLVHINYFMFYWSMCRIFVLNTCKAWKRDSVQIKIFVYVCLLVMKRISNLNDI